jgi:hypothetical protein
MHEDIRDRMVAYVRDKGKCSYNDLYQKFAKNCRSSLYLKQLCNSGELSKRPITWQEKRVFRAQGNLTRVIYEIPQPINTKGDR